ncbi:RING finger protein 215-like isoform X1 [Glandiceps talaboti]
MLWCLLFLQTVLCDRTATVNVYNNRKVDGDSEFQVLGNFTGIGSVGSAEGGIRILSSSCGDSEDQLLTHQKDWVGVLYLTTVTNDDHIDIDKPCCSFVDRVKEVMLFGASALIILANVDTQMWMQLDVSQLFTKPIVFINETKYVNKFMNSLQRAGKSFLVKISYNVSYYDLKSISTITLWSTCGRARGGGYWGTVCFGDHASNSQVTYSNWLYIVLSGLFICALLLMVRSPHLFRNPMYDADDIDVALQDLTIKVLSKMKTRCYSHKKRKHRENEGEPTCSICLERYFPKQVIRVLPCSHEYHTKCVDEWLIKQRTCPLCKLNIIDHQFGQVKVDS